MEEIHILIKSAITSTDLHTHYQPLYQLEDNKLFSYESLLRCIKDINPEELFEMARNESKTNELDKCAIEKGIYTYSDYQDPNEPLLFINILPSTLLQSDFIIFLDQVINQSGFRKESLVFELSENAAESKQWEFPELKAVISKLRSQGIRFAIDDVGRGIACNQKIIEFEPEFVKLDKYFGIGLAESRLKQMTVKSYAFLCKGSSTLILEGIETEKDLELAKKLGVDIGQGYFLGKPSPL